MAPSDERRRVSYPVSDSMSCRRRVRVPVPHAELTLRSARTDGLGDRSLFSRSRPPPPGALSRRLISAAVAVAAGAALASGEAVAPAAKVARSASQMEDQAPKDLEVLQPAYRPYFYLCC